MSWKRLTDSFLGLLTKITSGPAKKIPKGVDDSLTRIEPTADHEEELQQEESKPRVLQFQRRQKKLQRQQLVIGFDFGTAFTKVIIGESRRRYVVPFNTTDGSPSVCAPCIFYIDNEGYGSLSPTGACDKRDNLKMPLIEGNSEPSQRAEIIVYIALVLRYARDWLNTKYYTIYQEKTIDWYVNIGLPTEKYEDKKMENVYCAIVRAAWYLSINKEKISINDAIQCLNILDNGLSVDTERWIHTDKVNCFPEFAAMVSGYVRSPRRRKDLHILIDIGAGTVDVTVFNVHRNQEEDIFPIFAKGVQPLGVSYLLRRRYEKLGIEIDIDPTQNAQDNESFAKSYSLTLDRLNEIDEVFCKNFFKLVGGLLHDVKKVRYPTSPRWQEGIPCFLCGGGRDIRTYRDELNKFQDSRCSLRIVFHELPFPNDLDLEELIKDNIYRLLVAYGLSYDPDDIGGIIKSQDIFDLDPSPTVDIDDFYYNDYSSRIDR